MNKKQREKQNKREKVREKMEMGEKGGKEEV